MKDTHLRLLVVADESLREREDTFVRALELLRQDYEVVDGLTLSFEFEYTSFDDVPWEDYWGDGKSFGLNIGWIKKKHKALKNKYGEEFASVMYLVSPENWKAPSIGGWNLGQFFSGMSAQICKGYMTERSSYLVFSMELAHALNEQVYREIGVRLRDVLKVDNWDYEVIHGEGSDYKVFEYRPVFMKIADELLRTFKRKEARFTGQLKSKVALLIKLVDLYRQVMILFTKVKSPVYDEELENKNHTQ